MKKSMNGREQVNALSRLAEPFKPDNLAGFRVGDHVRLPSIDVPMQVVGLADPLLILQSPSGHQLRAGWQAVTKIRTRADQERGS